MTDEASTAYICIYCPFNSDNLKALEDHLTNAHGHGCQDTPLQSLAQSSSSNFISKVGKREAPDDEQSQSSLNGIKHMTEHSTNVKRIKRTLSPATSTTIFINSDNDNDEDDDDDDDDSEQDDEDDERDSGSNPGLISAQHVLTCPTCGSTYHRRGHLLRHMKRKHRNDLSNYDESHVSQTNQIETSNIEDNNTSPSHPLISPKDLNSSDKTFQQEKETNLSETNTTTDCPYCDYKTNDIEQFKLHIVAHIRDKNYRCLLCNRLYKYRGDCSFHIRRKHHRYSANSNDYIQRFLFDTTDGDETMLTQSSGHSSTLNGSIHNTNLSRELDEPIRYFGCPYCDYTSNYGGDVRKHQTRKHPNFESKVIKIIRQDTEHQNLVSLSNNNHHYIPNDDNNNNEHDDENGDNDNDDEDNITNKKSNINLTDQQERKDKIKTVKKIDPNLIQQNPTSLPILSNFAPVRVFQCSSCHQQGTYKWVVERHIRAKHPEQHDAHVIELPAELSVKLQKITPPLKRFRCSLCPLQSKHTWVIIRHIKHFHTLQTASVLDIQPDGTSINDESLSFQNGDLLNKSCNNDSDDSSMSSSYIENGIDEHNESYIQQDLDNENDQNGLSLKSNNSMIFIYKCSACELTSNVPWNIQKHITDTHSEQPNAHMLTQCRSTINDNNQKLNTKKLKHKNSNITATVTKTSSTAPLSPKSALAKAKFSPAVEEALLSLQGSKINSSLYNVQPKFGIKRLKCRHCFYRSNWKTDMIRHVRIRHNLTEPDHHKDMIVMTEQEARSTIEAYENTFGKELRRRTFRTWNDWAKAEEEFTPKDGSLQYINSNVETSPNDNNKLKKNILTTITGQISSSMINDEITRLSKPKIENESNIIISNYQQSLPIVKEEYKQLPNPSNIVSRLLLTVSPPHTNDDDAPLDLSLKPSSNVERHYQISILNENNDDLDETDIEENSTFIYVCSACPYKRSNLSLVQRHLSTHLSGQGVVCPLCSYTTSNDKSMDSHMTIIHPTSQKIAKYQSAKRIPDVTIIKQYQCENSNALEFHHRLEHKNLPFNNDSLSIVVDENNHDNNINLPVDTNNNIFQCPLCTSSLNSNNNYSNLEQFTMHIFTNHTDYIHNNQSCPFCSFIAHTTSTYTVIDHIKLHFNGTLVQPDPTNGIENVKELLIE